MQLRIVGYYNNRALNGTIFFNQHNVNCLYSNLPLKFASQSSSHQISKKLESTFSRFNQTFLIANSLTSYCRAMLRLLAGFGCLSKEITPISLIHSNVSLCWTLYYIRLLENMLYNTLLKLIVQLLYQCISYVTMRH